MRCNCSSNRLFCDPNLHVFKETKIYFHAVFKKIKKTGVHSDFGLDYMYLKQNLRSLFYSYSRRVLFLDYLKVRNYLCVFNVKENSIKAGCILRITLLLKIFICVSGLCCLKDPCNFS